MTNKGIGPGGDLTTIVYEGFMRRDGLPKTVMSLKRFFDPDYYRGKIPVFDPSIFHTTRSRYERGGSKGPRPDRHSHRGGIQHAHTQKAAPPSGKEENKPTPKGPDSPVKTTLQESLEGHRVLAYSCKKPRGFRRISLKAGSRFAREGEVFGFDVREIRLGKCEEVEVTLENTDTVRHALMLPELNPMLNLEFTGPGKRTARFVTPDEDITLEFHCHVPMHEEMGMHGRIIVGKGGVPKTKKPPSKQLYVGVGTVIALQPRKSQIVVDHGEIKGFMAPMIMGYPVWPVSLLDGLKPGDRIRFTIDAGRQAIIRISRGGG